MPVSAAEDLPHTTAGTGPAGGGDDAVLVDLDDAALRARGTVKWSLDPPGVLPAWVAETDFAPCPPVARALHRAVDAGGLGYPGFDAATGVPEATAGLCSARWGWGVDPARVVLTGDVMAGVVLALGTLCEPGGVVVPTPAYPPFLAAPALAGRELVAVPLDPDAPAATLDLTAVDDALAAGARTVLLCNPHNPWGRAFDRAELAGLRDVVLRHGARVVSDEVHAPLVLPGAVHVPYATVAGTAEHTVTVLAASKAWDVAGLKCAQLVTGTAADTARLRALPGVANHGLSPLGAVATVAAYTEGGGWLDAVVERLDANRALLSSLLAEHLPAVRTRPLEATYLAWLDARATGDDPAGRALRDGRVRLNDGETFGPGGGGHVRLNLATSPQRVTDAVARMAAAWTG